MKRLIPIWIPVAVCLSIIVLFVVVNLLVLPEGAEILRAERSFAQDAPESQRVPRPLCKRFSQYVVRKADLNRAVSPCRVHIHADASVNRPTEKHFRVVVRRCRPVDLDEWGHPVAPRDQLRPYHYKWLVLDESGKVTRSWLAYFLRNRDGTYHTVVSLPPDEWRASVLDVYFEDVNGDGVREDVTYRLMVGDILKEQ